MGSLAIGRARRLRRGRPSPRRPARACRHRDGRDRQRSPGKRGRWPPPDPLSAAYAAPIARRAAASVANLAMIMARLRSPDGCPWDREQSHESLRVHLIEEAHEVLEAIDRGELGTELEE